jgi:hypothetical protein
MKEIIIKEEFRIPGTNIVLEKNDIICIKENIIGSIRMIKDYSIKWNKINYILKRGDVYSIYKANGFADPAIVYPLAARSIYIPIDKIDQSSFETWT